MHLVISDSGITDELIQFEKRLKVTEANYIGQLSTVFKKLSCQLEDTEI